MLNSENNADLLRLDAASSVYTREMLGSILDACSEMLKDETLSGEIRGKLANIDAECCRLIRNRLLLSTLTRFRLENAGEHCCSFTDVFTNCCATVDAICTQTKAIFEYSRFYLPIKLPMTADNCCLAILLPIAVALERDPETQIRLIASKHTGRIDLDFTFSGEAPDLPKLAAECSKSDGTSGLFFEESLMAECLTNILSDCGSIMSVKGNRISVSIPIASEDNKINSPCEPYIDNRFSLPYIVLSRIVKREI